MPTYGYRCSRGHHWEVVQRITEAPLNQCAECGAPATRVFYPVGIVFKGQGFYKTDSRGSGGIAPATTGDGAADKDGKGTKEAAKTDTKTPAASEGKDSAAKADAPSAPAPSKTEEKSAS